MAEALPGGDHDTEPEVSAGIDDRDVLRILGGYKHEAEVARKSGHNPRDDVWRANWDLYWGRYDFSAKAEWQSRHVMPEVPQFVDRWAAAMREAMMQAGRWYSAEDPASHNREFEEHIEKLMDVLLARAGRTHTGHPCDFSAVFEDQMKLGALTMCCASVTWKDSPEGGWVAVESVDPQTYWLDPHGRNMYRVRRVEMEHYQLMELADLEDEEGGALYDREAIEALSAGVDEDGRHDRERITGHGAGASSGGRKTIQIDEYLCDLVSDDGEVIARNALVVVANDKYVIRGPEENPFWHQRDWIVSTPMVTVPLSVYGRSYLEDWADPARAFTEMTNLILDGVFTTTMNVFSMQPDMLQNPADAVSGVHPNKTFMLEQGGSVREFLQSVDMGQLPPEAITVWQALKQEMKEGAKLNEIALGQIPTQRGEITATEVSQVQQSSSATVRSMAQTIETRFLEPVLTLMFHTALQHMDFANDERIRQELGEETSDMLAVRRDEFRDRGIKFRVRGLSGMVDRQAKLRNILNMLQVVGQNEILLQTFMQRFAPDKVLEEIMYLFGVDTSRLELTERETQMRQLQERMQQGAEGRTGFQDSRPDQPEQPQQGDGVDTNSLAAFMGGGSA